MSSGTAAAMLIAAAVEASSRIAVMTVRTSQQPAKLAIVTHVDRRDGGVLSVSGMRIHRFCWGARRLSSQRLSVQVTLQVRR